MKAAVLKAFGTAPVYEDFSDPVPDGSDQLVINMKAAAIKNIDRLRASGQHYASYKTLPAVVGIDGVGALEDGTLVYAQGLSGMIAEKAVIFRNRMTILPDNINISLAAALPNAVMGAAMALHARAKVQQGDVVLINGATGVTGQLAVQLARYYGASKIIVTGRNAESLDEIKALNADFSIPLAQEDGAFITQLKEIHRQYPVDVVVDYLWGHPMELILRSMKGEGANAFTPKTTVVSVGDLAGKTIALESEFLRSADMRLIGSGFGSLSQDDVMAFNSQILPEMFRLAAEGKLKMAIDERSIKDVATAWDNGIGGKRTVLLVD